MPNNIEKLYQNLKADGYQLGTIDEFTRNMSDSTKADKLYQNLSADGYQLGSREDFFGKIRPQRPQPQQPTQQLNYSATVQQPQQPAPQPMQLPQGFGEYNIQQANQMGAGLGPTSWEQSQQEPKEETVVDKQARMLQGKATPQEQKQVQNRMQQRKDEIDYENETGKRLRQPVLNTEFEAPTLSRDENGNILRGEDGQPLIGNTTDQDRASTHQQVMAEQAAWDSLSDKEKQERAKQMQLEMEQNEYEEPGFLGVTGKKLASGFIKAGLGLLNGMKALTSGMIVEDASSPTGYSKTEDYNPATNTDAINRGLEYANQYAERLSREGEPRKGASFTDMLLDGDIGGFLLKGWGSALESAPMTLSIYNPYTMALNAISMAGNNFRENTIENPDIPAWKRASMAIGSAAIEQAVEKFSDPVFKHFNGGRVLSWFGKKASEETTKKIAKEAESVIARRIMSVLKDAGAEGMEEVVTNFGNDALGQALDWLDGESDYGIAAQWQDLKKRNPNANLQDFAMQKAKENLDSFFGGALGGAYMSGSAQITAAGFQYATGYTVNQEQMAANPNAPIHPATLDIAQSYDEGYTMENEQDVANAKANYEAQRQRATEMLGETKGLDENPTQTLQTMQEGLQDGSYTPEQVQAALDYVDAKATVDGIQQHIVEENRANRHNFIANGNNIDEVDAQGNVVATHEYENADEMRTALWELQANREHDDIMTDINIAKVNPKYDYNGIIGAFAEETGLDVDYIESILSKDPLELEDGESAMVAEFAEILHNTIYGNTTVHTDQSAQDGANLADEMGIDLNNLSPAQVEQAHQIVTDMSAAQQALNQAFAADENLQQEVARLENEGMPKQGIVSTLGELGFRPNQVQAVIDYYNADAKYNGFVLQMSNKINEAAANERQRHTLKGTIDGKADLNNVHIISDGTNNYYLVSGDITTDPATGRITGSGSGLIIGMDLDGSFVNIGDTNGYSVMPVTQTLDQWEEAERIRLQEQMTATIDPTGSMNPQMQPQKQSGTAEGAAGGTNTGANNPSATSPVAEAEVEQTQQPVQIPVDEKTGVKMYEQGVPVDDAIADMEADGLDVNAEADLAINEAQAELDKIGQPKTRAERVKNDTRRKELQNAIDYYNNVKARWAEVQQAELPSESEENVNVQPEQPQIKEKPVSSQQNLTVEEQKQQRIAEAKAKYGELFDDDFTKANDVYELVSMWIGRKRNLAWTDVNGKRGLQKELGWTRKIGKKDSDTKYIETLLAKNGEGVGVDEFVHMVWESPENDIMGEKRWSTEEIKEALLDLLKSAQSKSDVVDYALNTRIAAAEAALQEQQKQAAEETEQQAELKPMTPEQIAEMEANLPFATRSDKGDVVALLDAIADLQQQEGMPPIKLVDTDRMSDDEWYDIASNMYGGAFVSQEEIETVRNYVMEQGVFYDAETNTITVFSDGQTAEIVKQKVETTKDIINGRSNEEESGELETDVVPRNESETPQGEAAETPAAETRQNSESQGSPESVEDPYLQPRNAEEEQIIANVIAQLQQEIGEAVEEQNKARSELEKAMARESERATDMFANDNALNKPGQLFDNSEMPIDNSVEGVKRRTAAERERLQDVTNRLNQLQSEQERNSRIRGALDNHRRQTKIETEEQPQTQSREDYLASHPLTEEQIMADTEANEDEKLNAIDFLNGEDSVISRFYYDQIYERAQKKADTIAKRKARFQGKEEKSSETNPMAAIEKAADEFRAEQERKAQDQKDIDDALKEFNDFLDNAKGSSVLDKFMRKGLEGNDKAQASLLDAFTLTNDAQRMFLKDLLRLASKVGYAYIKSGVHDVQAWSKKMSDSIGAKLKEVLGWEDSIVNEFVDEVWNQKYTVDGQRMRLSEHAERLKNGKGADTTVNVNKQENNEPKNVVSSQQEPASELEGDSAEFADRQYKIEQLNKKIRAKLQGIMNWGDQPKPLSAYKQIAKELGIENLSDTDLQELIETEVVNLAREIANKEGLTDEKKFQKIVKLYEGQPSLNARDNDRINKQQYSTPAPMAYLMGQFLSNGKKVESGLEPSAGNGMLTINLPKDKMHVNDIDEMRLSNLQKQGFGEVTSQDGLQSFGEKKFDVVVTNPPFGNVTPKVYDGIYEISGLEHQMAINALESMKDDGRAAIIIGGNTEYNQNGSIKGKDRAFLNYLYAHYNVVDVINMDGKTLYSRQGTGFPVRMILINGRKEFNPRNFAPVIQKARAERVNSYDELFKRVNDDILSDNNKPAGVHDTESGESRRVDDTSNAGTSTQTGVRNVQSAGSQRQSSERPSNGSSVSGSSNTTGGTDTKGKPAVDTRPTGVGSRAETSQPSRSTTEQAGEKRNEPGGNDTERPVATTDNSQRVGQRGAEPAQQPEQPAVKRGLGTEKVPYRKQSGNPFTLQSLMPAEQADVVKSALEELGDVDQFLVDELGYSSKEELHQALAAEQIDSVALAIHQMNQGNAFIIGDQTGIGKGRQAAALIRYGVKKGGFPVFITVKKALFSDMYRDLCDIGSPKLRPFIWSADDTEHSGNVTDKNGNVIYQTPNAKEQKRVIDYINKNGKLPPEYDYVLTTYDSFKSGTMDYEGGQKKERKFPKGKKPGPVHLNGQAKRDALETLAQNSYVIMDESHNAGGEGSNVSNYLQYITTKAKGLTFLSATFAKRPGNMPIYSLKTAISKAGVKVNELIDAVKRGGATFQEIMSKALTEAGQMIRRERDMTGVTIDWKGIEDEDVIQKQREQYDTVIGLFNDIIQFQRTYVDPIVNGLNDAAAEEQGEVDHTPGTRDMGINNTPFASRTYNMVQQVLLSLKAEEAAKRAIEHLKLGRKPVITVANTNEGAADEVAGADGESMEMPDLSVNLKKGLQGTMRITKKDAFGNTVNEMIPFDRLSEEGQKRYAEIMDAIENASSGLSLSPIDVIKNELKKAGYKVGELTGRKAEFIYNDDGTVKRVKRQDTDKKKIAADFNNGKLDALILNRSAGTGISLHASSTFKDQRQRIMIVAQAQGDVNDEVQIRGRIDRTGQVLRGMYEYVVSQIPSEQRLLMMLKSKLRSLDANTTSSQKSKFNEMQVQDIINKYGDDIVIQYLSEHVDLAMKMCDPLKWGEGAETLPAETLVSQAQKAQGDGATASKVLGRMALLTVKEQEKMLKEIGDLYQAEIDRLNEMGENDLEITEMPLRAKTLKKDVWEAGVEPGGKNPFADNSYVEEVEMDVLRKPMKAEEVKKSQARLLGGKTWDEYKQGVLDKVDKWAEKKKAEATQTITERAEKKAAAEQEKYVKGAKKAQDKNGMTDEEIEKNGKFQYNTFYKQEMEKLDNALEAVDKQKQAFIDALETFNTNNVYALPTDIYDLSQLTFEPSFGRVIDINIKEDNFSTTASTITFATLDGRRKITIPISGMVKQNNGEKKDIKPVIVSQTAQTRNGFYGSNIKYMLDVLELDLPNWDRLTSTAARKKGYIITGNLLKALTSLRSQGKGGKLISYTTDTGEIRQGILMGDNFDPGSLTSKNPISSVTQILKDGGQVVSADGDVVIVKTDGIDWSHTKPGRHTEWFYELGVPKSKKRGEKYFNDETLLSLMDDQFEGTSRMKALFPERNLNAVLKRLDELGVTVESAKEDSDTPKRMITTSDPIEAINQAADSWRSSAKESESSLSKRADVDKSENNSVPLERRTLKSYTDKDENYHKGIEEELRDLESEISGRSSRENQEGGSQVGSSHGLPNSGRRVNDLRRQAAKLRAEIARRNQNKQELSKKYNIDEKGNISLNDLRRMFNDLNSNKVLGKLFDKVFDILDQLGTKFRFTNGLDALSAGEAHAFFNVTFLNWDAFTRGRTDQQKAKTILHEMIHNVAYQLIERYSDPNLPKLSTAQEKLAKQIVDIYNIVDKAIPYDENGERAYGAKDAHEMLSEMANPEFRKLLDTIPYRDGMSVLRRIVEWFKDLFGSFGLDIKGNTAFDSLNKALEEVIMNYDERGINDYKSVLSMAESDMRNAGWNGEMADYAEQYLLNNGGASSLVEDKDLIDKLEKEPKVTVYRAMQLQDGKLYPPMAAKINGKLQDPLPIGEWSQADEHPELVDKNGKFTLDKGNGKTVAGVVYAPYMHGSTTMLNDQFKEAQDRPELVVVEAEMPESELTSGYQAEKSPRKTGMLDWKAGTIQGQLTGTRQVMLSRWVKPIRIVPSSEVAANIKEMIDGQVDVMPTNVVTPEQREELEKLGVKFVKTNNQEIVQEGEHKGEQYSDAYGKKSKKSRGKTTQNNRSDADPIQAIKDAASKWARSKADREGMTPEAHSAKAMYDRLLNQVATVFTEAYRDHMISLKKAIDAIVGGKDIPDSQNPYMAYNLMHGKNKVEMDAFNRKYRDPMLATIHKIMTKTGMNWGDIDMMLFTKSGLERNRQLYVRDLLEKKRKAEDADKEELDRIENEWNQLKQDLYDQLKRGDITYADYLEEMRLFIRANLNRQYDPNKHDYSGFRDMYGDEDGKYDEADIIAQLADTEDKIGSDHIKELWSEINAANEYSLERYREAGMRSDEQIDKIKQMFNFYVPMRGFKGESAEDVYQYMTNPDENGVRHLGGLMKHAKGRGSEADFPVSTMFSMAYKAIADCNKNIVNQKFYRLVQANPNDLVILSDSWAKLNESTGEWEEDVPNIPEDATEDEVRRITLNWEDEMRQLAREEKAKKIRGKAEFDYKSLDKKNRKEHIVEVRINGQKKLMTIAGNPRAAQALNGQLGFEREKGAIVGGIVNAAEKSKATKWFADFVNGVDSFGAKLLRFRQAVSTNYSLNFVWRNAKRDWSHFSMLCVAKEGGGYTKAAEKYYFESMAGKGRMRSLFKKYREGTLDESKEIERDFKDFMDNGGITGFVQMQKVDEVQKDLEKLMKAQKAGKPFDVDNSFWDKMLTAIEAYNEAIENRARFATYRASRHYAGRTKARSAYDAKEITANFNKRGAGRKTARIKSSNPSVEAWAKIFGKNSQLLNENKMFFNASVQAIATLGSGLKNADNKTRVAWFAKALSKRLFKYGALPFALASFGVPMLNLILMEAFGGGDDDDPYANLPEWVRRNNICIYIGKGNFCTFAIGQELAAFYSLGDMTAGMTFYPELKPVDKNMTDEIIGFLSVFSPVDVQTKVTQDDKGLVESAMSNYIARIYSNAAPFVNISENLSWSGRPIYKEDTFGRAKYEPEYKQVFDGTGTVYKAVSQGLNWLGGGDEVSRGAEWSQINPATMEYLTEQYFGGVGRFFVNTGDIVGDIADVVRGKESDFNIRKVEGLRALIQQSDDRTQYYRTKAKFKKYKDEAEKLEHDIKGWAEMAEYDPNALMKLESLTRGNSAARLSIYLNYKPYLQKINSARNKAEGSDKKHLNTLYNQTVKNAVEELDKVKDIE